MDEARSVRDFWFGPLPLSAQDLNRRMRFWFGGEPSQVRQRRDDSIRARFAALLERAAAGELAAWADGPRRRLSLIILLDQFPRNIYRGTARAFAYDEQALAPHALGNAVRGGRRARCGGTHLLLHAAAACREP